MLLYCSHLIQFHFNAVIAFVYFTSLACSGDSHLSLFNLSVVAPLCNCSGPVSREVGGWGVAVCLDACSCFF